MAVNTATTPKIEGFDPLIKPSGGFEELKRLVIDQGVCSYCSTCAALCERVVMGEDGLPVCGSDLESGKDCTMKMGSLGCSDNGTCYDCCPMISFSVPDMEKSVFGRTREDAALGCYEKIAAVRSKNKKILENAQDGGCVTSLLACALETGMIDGAVVSWRGKDWTPSSGVATDPEELLKSAGTKYSRVPATMTFGSAIKDYRRLAMVGTGCQTTGARRALEGPLKNLVEITSSSKSPLDFILIGLFCFENMSYDCMKKTVESSHGVKLEDVVKTDITKGQFIVHKKDGEKIKQSVKIFNHCLSDSCHLCTNFTSYLADISVGSVGTDPGWSTVIVRTKKGMELFDRAVKAGYIEVQDKVMIDAIKFNFGLKEKHRKQKKEEREKEGKYVPEYGLE